jgi:hypothetical protein
MCGKCAITAHLLHIADDGHVCRSIYANVRTFWLFAAHYRIWPLYWRTFGGIYHYAKLSYSQDSGRNQMHTFFNHSL